MLHKTCAVMAVFILIFVFEAAGSVKAAEAEQNGLKPAKCTVEQGQIFIDEGRYTHAVREFTCVINDDPTGRMKNEKFRI